MKPVKKRKYRIRFDRLLFIIIVIVLIAFVLVCGGYFTFKMMNKVKDSEPPKLLLADKTYYIFEGSTFNIEDITYEVSDDFDKNIQDKVEMEKVDTSKLGEGSVKISACDQTGKMSSETIKYVVLPLSKERESLREELCEYITNPDDITVLVNKLHFIPEDYAPQDLVSIDAVGHTLRKEAAQAYGKMEKQAQLDGIYFFVVSATRTKEYQQELYDNYLKEDANKAFTYSAIARTSEHELGLAIDISEDGSLDNNLQDKEVGKWLAKNASEYGFILRYPSGSESITGYSFEPWHYRYVGKELAKELTSKNITLEEYYQK